MEGVGLELGLPACCDGICMRTALGARKVESEEGGIRPTSQGQGAKAENGG